MAITNIIIGAFAVWRLAFLLVNEVAINHIFKNMRTYLTKRHLDDVIPVHCIYCASVWIALPVAIILVDGFWETVIGWLALSGGAILINGVVDRLDS